MIKGQTVYFTHAYTISIYNILYITCHNTKSWYFGFCYILGEKKLVNFWLRMGPFTMQTHNCAECPENYQDPFANSWTFYINVYHQVPNIHNWKFHFPHIIECLILLMPHIILKCKLRSPRSSFYSSNCKCTSPAT